MKVQQNFRLSVETLEKLDYIVRHEGYRYRTTVIEHLIAIAYNEIQYERVKLNNREA